MKSRQRRNVLLSSVALLGVARPSFGQEVIKIGVVASLTGGAAYIGEDIRNTAELMRDLVNAQGGIKGRKIETVTYDDASDPTKAVTAIRRLHDHGVMVNGSFVFGLDGDESDVFARTVDWAVASGITTATFHILTPYPGTALHAQMEAQGRITSRDWDLYDTRHVVYRPALLAPDELESGYHRAYQDFYRWSSIARAASAHAQLRHRLKHFFYSAGWKKFEPAWDLVIRLRQLAQMRPLLEAVLSPVAPESEERKAEQRAVGKAEPGLS